MNVLIACEESQRVCKEFRELGHNAYSCDILDCSGGHPECIEAIRGCMSRDGFQDFCRGSVIKYLWRYRLKASPLADLQKALDYLNWMIESVEGNDNHNK